MRGLMHDPLGYGCLQLQKRQYSVNLVNCVLNNCIYFHSFINNMLYIYIILYHGVCHYFQKKVTTNKKNTKIIIKIIVKKQKK